MSERDIIFLVGVVTIGGTLVVFVWQALQSRRRNRSDDEGEDRGDDAER